MTDRPPLFPDGPEPAATPPVADPGTPRHWLVRPNTIRLLRVVSVAVLALSVAADALVHGHASSGLDGTFGFYAWYGFSTCVLMVAVAKILGFFLKREDTYYD